jgi:hypothetical protein
MSSTEGAAVIALALVIVYTLRHARWWRFGPAASALVTPRPW